MNKNLIKPTTPEESELLEKRAELDRLCAMLADKELQLEDMQLSVARFQSRYFTEVGKKYVEIDELRAKLAELRSRNSPQDQAKKDAAHVARETANKSAEEYQDSDSSAKPQLTDTEASETAKKLYRQIASTIHPDKSTDKKSRQLRTRLMAELNEAYAQRDIERMQIILSEWEQSPDAIEGEGTALELVRTIRAIAQVKRRMAEIEKTIADLAASDTHVLMVEVNKADLQGRNILAEMTESIDLEIDQIRKEMMTFQR